MRGIWAFAAFAAALAADGGQVWNLDGMRPWAREAKAMKFLRGEGGRMTVVHTGEADWALQHGIPDLAVKPGERYRLSCATKPAGGAGDAGGPRLGVSVVLYGEKAGGPVSWAYSPAYGKPGERISAEFIVPKGGTRIRPRVTGHGRCGAEVSEVRLERVGMVDLDAGGPGVATLANGRLEVKVEGAAGGFSVKDLKTGRTWEPVRDGLFGYSLERLEKSADGRSATAKYVKLENVRSLEAKYELQEDESEVLVTVESDAEGMRPYDVLAFPRPFQTVKGERLIVPLNEGISYPVEEEDNLHSRLVTFSGHGICMAFWGVQNDATGSGMMSIFETNDDGALLFSRHGPDKLWSPGPGWQAQKGKFGYARRLRYSFLEKGGYVAMCKRYRAYAKGKGLVKTFAEKAKERPMVDRLLGAVNVWTWEKDKVRMAKELKKAGIDRFLWSAGGSPEQVREIGAMENVLVSRYDVYQDVYHPQQLKELGWKKGQNTDAWPHDIAWAGPSSNEWSRAWPVKTKEGKWTYCARMCDAKSLGYCRRKVGEELKTHPYNTRFIDTTVASAWNECWNPAHPMTRSDSRRWRMELLRILGDEFNLVVGSETGHDASAPVCDFYEGMLSLGCYRVPESGRNLHEIWTNPPPNLVKYQVGEKYRLPLWELVYHDCTCAHWYWGDYNNKLPALWDKRDLFNVLYGTMGMFLYNAKQWEELKGRFARSYRLTSPVARATGYSEMVDHRILSADRSVQRTVFANGTVVTVNFGEKAFTLEDGTAIGPMTPIVK